MQEGSPSPQDFRNRALGERWSIFRYQEEEHGPKKDGQLPVPSCPPLVPSCPPKTLLAKAGCVKFHFTFWTDVWIFWGFTGRGILPFPQSFHYYEILKWKHAKFFWLATRDLILYQAEWLISYFDLQHIEFTKWLFLKSNQGTFENFRSTPQISDCS